MQNSLENKLNLPMAIVLGCVILGFAFYMVQVNKQNSIERQAQAQIELENKARADKLAEESKQQQLILEKQQREAEIKKTCSVELQRNGNYLVSNETLNTNYNSCLHSYGL